MVINKVTFIDEDGNWVIEPKFDDAFEFNKGKDKVVLQGKMVISLYNHERIAQIFEVER